MPFVSLAAQYSREPLRLVCMLVIGTLVFNRFPLSHSLHSQEGPAQEDLRTAHASSKEVRRKEEGRRE